MSENRFCFRGMKLTCKKLKLKSSAIKTATEFSQKEFEYLAKIFEQEWKNKTDDYTFKGEK